MSASFIVEKLNPQGFWRIAHTPATELEAYQLAQQELDSCAIQVRVVQPGGYYNVILASACQGEAFPPCCDWQRNSITPGLSHVDLEFIPNPGNLWSMTLTQGQLLGRIVGSPYRDGIVHGQYAYAVDGQALIPCRYVEAGLVKPAVVRLPYSTYCDLLHAGQWVAQRAVPSEAEAAAVV